MLSLVTIKFCEFSTTVGTLTKVEDHFAGQDIVFINIDTNEVKDISVTSVPSIVYFKNGEPEPYTGKCLSNLFW